MKNDHYYISCGGTGGHFYPGLSIARELKKQDKDVTLLLSGVNSLSQSQAAAVYGITSLVLPKMPSPGKNPLRWLQFLWGLAGGFLITLVRFLKKRPRSLFIMGSFASAPAAAAAFFLRVPLYLHDGNARIGKANRFLSRQAKLLCTAFPAVNAAACRCPVLCTGMPIRPELEEKRHISRKEAIDGLNQEYGKNLSQDLFTILIFGGSQGAATLNKTLPEALKKLSGKSFQVIHLTGKGKLAETEKIYENSSFKYLLLESSPRMELFLGSADLVFSRSGGSSVAELTLFGKSAVLIPVRAKASAASQPACPAPTTTASAVYSINSCVSFILFFENDIFNVVDFFGDLVVEFFQFLHFIARVHDRRMIAPAERFADKIEGEGNKN